MTMIKLASTGWVDAHATDTSSDVLMGVNIRRRVLTEAGMLFRDLLLAMAPHAGEMTPEQLVERCSDIALLAAGRMHDRALSVPLPSHQQVAKRIKRAKVGIKDNG